MVFEEFIAWRAICRKDANIKDASIILMWHGENYLLKMSRDVAPLYKYSVMRLWLEFEPNMLMLPPIQIAASNMQIRHSLEQQMVDADMHSITSQITGDNVNDRFFGMIGTLPPLGTSIEDDLMSQVSDTSIAHWRSFYSN